MCGHVGKFGLATLQSQKAFRELLTVDSVRGEDSSGVYGIHKNPKKNLLVKGVGTPSDLEFLDGYSELFGPVNLSNWRGYIGHNRAATNGAVTLKNAHPFQHDHIVLCHNGTLWPSSKNDLLGKEFETDSEQIALSVAEKGIDWTWERIIGAAVLVWWDQAEETLNFISDGNRSFYFAYTPNKSNIFWASEIWMLRGILGRNKINIEDNQIWFPTKNQLFSISYNIKKAKLTRESRLLKGSAEYAFDYGKEWGRRQKATTYIPPSSRSHENVLDFNKRYNIHKDELLEDNTEINDRLSVEIDKFKKDITESEFQETYKDIGCVYCGESVVNEFEECIILDEETVVCHSCALTAQLNGIPIG